MIELRPYQKRLLSDITEAMRSYKHCMVQLSTGGGKTLLFSEIARRASLKGSNVLILSNRTELLNQAGGSLDRIGVKCEYISPKHRRFPIADHP